MKNLLIGMFVLWAFDLGVAQQNTIPAKAEEIQPLLIGMKIPELKLQNLEGKEVSLNELVAQKPTVLIFYRGGWCPFCNKQLAGLQEIQESLVKMGYQILAISPDKVEKLQATVEKNTLSYTLLSDAKMEVAKALGIAFEMKGERYAKLLEESSGEKHHLLPVPTVMILDKEGVIKFEYINPNYKERLHPKLLMTAAEVNVTP